MKWWHVLLLVAITIAVVALVGRGYARTKDTSTILPNNGGGELPHDPPGFASWLIHKRT